MEDIDDEHVQTIDDAWWCQFRACCSVNRDLKKAGMTAFDDDGRYGGEDGALILRKMLGLFSSSELYDNCPFLRDLYSEYIIKFNRIRQEPIIPMYMPCME
jgi:hypothetical protein